MPAVVKIICVLIAVMALNRKLPMFGSLLIGSVMIGLWMGLEPTQLLGIMWREITTPTCLWLSGIIILILLMSHLLTKSKQIDTIFDSFKAVSPGQRFTLVSMPALIGLLPMPGGALFSAPMVDTALGKSDVKPEIKVVLNYWFRHIWEYWWPLYPGVILAISLFGLEPWKMIACQSPLTLAAVAGGALFLFSVIPKTEEDTTHVDRSSAMKLIVDTMPIWIVILGIFVVRVALDSVAHVFDVTIPGSKYASFVVSLFLAIALVIKRSPASAGTLKDALLDPKTYYLVLAIAAVLSFKGVLVESHAIDAVKQDLAAYHVPAVIVMVFLPFLAGVITGIAIGFVGASFPLVVTLVPEGASPYAYATLAYGFGYLGMMLSPVHICFVVSKEYFSADLGPSYKYMWKPVFVVAVWTVVLFLIYQWIHIQ